MLGNKRKNLRKYNIRKKKMYDKKYSKLLKNLRKKIKNLDSKSEYIVSLTSYGERLKTVWLSIQSIFDQNCKLAKVVLWVAHKFNK